MPDTRQIAFGISAYSAPDSYTKPDRQEYTDLVEDCGLAYRLGYQSVWAQEHHCTPYFSMPSPLIFLASIAREMPEFDLGTCMLVLPWYNPIRLAGEIAMLSLLAPGKLYLGCGRGTSKSEYDAIGVSMKDSKLRYAECLNIVRKALTGEPFSFEGKFFNYPNSKQLRPTPESDKITLIGAVGTPPTAAIMGEHGVPPMFTAGFPNALLREMIATWRMKMAEHGRNPEGDFFIGGNMLIADTDEEALALGQKYFPMFFKMMLTNYAVDSTPWGEVEGYEGFQKVFGAYKHWASDAKALESYLRRQFVGSAETVAARVQELVDMGITHFSLSTHTPGVPVAVRRESIERFARDVAPRFSKTFGPRV